VKNLNSVFAAYAIGWAVFFLFYVTIAKRTSDLQESIDRLKNGRKEGMGTELETGEGAEFRRRTEHNPKS
jgi:hypothetical protein